AHVVISDSDTSPLVPPPVSPPAAPTSTPVMSPPELASAAHAQVEPFDLRISLGLQVARPTVTVPVEPPPASPLPAITPVMLPAPDRSGEHPTVPSALTVEM